MLSNYDLEKLCRIYKIPLNGVFAKDELEDVEPRDGNYIINLQSSRDGCGSHWEALILRGPEAFTFDSFAALPPTEISDFARESKAVKHLAYNRTVIQHLKSDSCGWYVLGLLLFIKEHPQEPLTVAANKYINQFGSDLKANETILSALFQGLPKSQLLTKFLKRKPIG